MVRVTDGDMSRGDVDEPYYGRAAFRPPIDELEGATAARLSCSTGRRLRDGAFGPYGRRVLLHVSFRFRV